jgi:YidC/Oxa1 family membrane protein insertase
MDKRLILAITISFLFLAAYSSVAKKLYPVENKNVTAYLNNSQAISGQAENINPDASVLVGKPIEKPAPAEQCVSNVLEEKDLYKINTDGLELKFSKRGGYLAEGFDKERKFPLAFKNIGIIKEWSEIVFKTVELPRGVSFEYTFEDGSSLKKVFRIKSDNSLELTVVFYNVNGSSINSYIISAGSANPLEQKDPMDQRYFEICSLAKDLVVRKPVLGQKNNYSLDGRIQWIGLRDRYFCSIVVPELFVNKADVEFLDKIVTLSLVVPQRSIPKGESSIEDVYKIYLGPQEEKRIKDFSNGTEQIINYGFFDSISKVLLVCLRFFHKLSNSWGLAILLVTILVYIVLFPLSLKSMVSMKKMQALAPKMEELKIKYKDNPKKLNIEIMELYKREKANPFAGCLPMILQIPVFFALYQLLMRFISLKGASFLWIKDLSEPDRLFVFNQNIPFIGNDFNILPILMAIIMFFQQKFTVKPASSSPEMEQQQKIMTMLMPVIFGVLFYKMSSGLVLYWSINSLLMFLFQWKISKAK